MSFNLGQASNGVAIGKPVEKRIVLSERYGKDNPGLAGGAGDVLESTESICSSILALSDKLASDPATKLVVTVLKTILEVRQKEKENQERAAINQKLDRLIGFHYKSASDLLVQATHGIQEEKRKTKWIEDAAKRFTDAANVLDTSDVLDSDSFMTTKSRFYAGTCYSMIKEPVSAKIEYEAAYKKGHEQWEQSCQEIERLRSLALGRGKSRAKEMENRLVDFYQQFMEPLKRLIENRPPTSDNAASTSYSTVGEFQRLTLKIIPGSERAIRKLYASGDNHRLAGREKEAIDDYSRVLILARGNHAEALRGRGEVKKMLGDYQGALTDLDKSLEIEPKSAFARGKRGQVHQAMGQDEKALADFDQALALNSSLDWVKKARGKIKAHREGFIIVDSSDADFSSISDAIKHVPEKTRIRVRPGTYIESIVLDKHVEIVGDGPREQIVLLSSNDASCIRVATDSAAVVRGMTIRGRAKDHCAIDIPRGHFHLSDCIVTCETQQPCIEIHNSTAQPLIEKCIIRDGGGIFVYNNGKGRFEECDISNNEMFGVAVTRGGDPLMSHCKMHDGQGGGILVYNNGKGRFEECDISNNKFSGVEVKTGGDPLMSHCKMHDGQYSGIIVHDNGKGRFEECDISNNELAGVRVKTGGDPLMSHCKMHDEQDSGIYVYDNGKGRFEECDISNNKRAGVVVSEGGDPLMSHCKMHDGQYFGIFVDDQGKGEFKNCETFANKDGGLYIKKGAYPVRRSSTFRDGEKREGS